MYHSSQSSQNFTQLAQLPLAKFSYTTTSLGHNGPLNWSHVIGDGELVGTFEKWTALGSSGRVILKIFRELDIFVRPSNPPLCPGTNMHQEEIDLTQFVREANSTQSKQKPCFAVIVKLPCLAVKYPSGSTYVGGLNVQISTLLTMSAATIPNQILLGQRLLYRSGHPERHQMPFLRVEHRLSVVRPEAQFIFVESRGSCKGDSGDR